MNRLLWVLLVLLTATGAASAEEGKSPPARVEMEEVEIRGEVEHPEVFYIIPRREVRMDLGPLSKDFGAEILQSLLPEPFEERVRQRRP